MHLPIFAGGSIHLVWRLLCARVAPATPASSLGRLALGSLGRQEATFCWTPVDEPEAGSVVDGQSGASDFASDF